MIDAVDELIAYRKQVGRLSPMLRRFHALHRRNRHLLDFLVQELRGAGQWCGLRFCSLTVGTWALGAGKARKGQGEQFAMANELAPYYARVLCILHPNSTAIL